MDSEEKEVALPCLLISDDGKTREKRKRKYCVRHIFRKINYLGAFSTGKQNVISSKNILNFYLTIYNNRLLFA